jgi:hypothetical protein
MDKPAYWTPRSEIKEGVTVQCSGFDCIPERAMRTVQFDDGQRAYVLCNDGRHYLDSRSEVFNGVDGYVGVMKLMGHLPVNHEKVKALLTNVEARYYINSPLKNCVSVLVSPDAIELAVMDGETGALVAPLKIEQAKELIDMLWDAVRRAEELGVGA